MLDRLGKWVNYLIEKEKEHDEEIDELKSKIKEMEEKQHLLGKSVLKVIGHKPKKKPTKKKKSKTKKRKKK